MTQLPTNPQSFKPLSASLDATSNYFGPIATIIHTIASAHGISSKYITGKKLDPAAIRHEAMYLAVVTSKQPLTAIARVFHCHHATLINGAAKHAARNGLPAPRATSWKRYQHWMWKKYPQFYERVDGPQNGGDIP